MFQPRLTATSTTSPFTGAGDTHANGFDGLAALEQGRHLALKGLDDVARNARAAILRIGRDGPTVDEIASLVNDGELDGCAAQVDTKNALHVDSFPKSTAEDPPRRVHTCFILSSGIGVYCNAFAAGGLQPADADSRANTRTGTWARSQMEPRMDLCMERWGLLGADPLAPALQEPDDQHEPDHDGTYDQHHRHENAAATKIAVAAARCMRIALLFLVKKVVERALGNIVPQTHKTPP